MWKLKKVTVVPIVIGAGSYVRYFEKNAGTPNVTIRLEVIQKSGSVGNSWIITERFGYLGTQM